MSKFRSMIRYFSTFEIVLWGVSVLLITTSFIVFDRSNYLYFTASLIGVTSLIFCAKGNLIGQILMIVFSFFYGYISCTFAYYGEMLTYVGMTMPMAAASLVSWMKNPYNGNRTEVRVDKLKVWDIPVMLGLAVAVTAIFYFILEYFNTANLIPSTISVTTSFISVYLTFRRSSFYALAYATNDVVLIVLWTAATLRDTAYVSVLVCFVVFLANDIYGFINWQRMERNQRE